MRNPQKCSHKARAVIAASFYLSLPIRDRQHQACTCLHHQHNCIHSHPELLTQGFSSSTPHSSNQARASRTLPSLQNTPEPPEPAWTSRTLPSLQNPPEPPETSRASRTLPSRLQQRWFWLILNHLVFWSLPDQLVHLPVSHGYTDTPTFTAEFTKTSVGVSQLPSAHLLTYRSNVTFPSQAKLKQKRLKKHLNNTNVLVTYCIPLYQIALFYISLEIILL